MVNPTYKFFAPNCLGDFVWLYKQSDSRSTAVVRPTFCSIANLLSFPRYAESIVEVGKINHTKSNNHKIEHILKFF